MARLSEVTKSLAERTAAAEFTSLCRALALGGSPNEARAVMGDRLSERVDSILAKADPGMIGGGDSPTHWGGALAGYETLAGAFLESLAHASVFDAAVSDMRQLPLRGRMPVAETTVGAVVLGEAAAKAPAALILDAVTLDPLKAAVIIFASKELLRFGGATAASLFNIELTNALVRATDDTFLTALVAATTPGASSGVPREDLTTLLSAIDTGADARIFVAVTPTIAKELAVYPAQSMPANTDLGPNGGTVAGVRVIASDELDTGTMLIFDARQIGGDRGTLGITAAEHASIDPAGGSNPTFSLWQKNCRGLRAERWFGFSVLRPSAVASLENVDYAAVASSPA